MADSLSAIPETSQTSRLSSFVRTYLPPLLVLVVGLVAAASIYQTFLKSHKQLWTSLIHDRNAHYWLGLRFAIDLRHADVPHLLNDLHKARVWPPLHPVLIGATMALGGLQDRIAVLPNLLGWVLTAVFAFLVARRSVRQGGNWAGLVAVTFVLVSPAHRAYATDIMLESLGACLTLAALYAFLVAVQEPSVRHGRWLGFSLTILFFQKYNYWLLVLMAVCFWLVVTYHPLLRERLWQLRQSISSRSWLRAQCKHPLNYLFLGLCVVIFLTEMGLLRNLRLFGKTISISSSVNLGSIAFFVLFVRMLPWYLRQGRQLVQALPAVPRQLVYWHGWPVLFWLLWPQRIWNFLWYLSPAQQGERPSHNMVEGWSRYWSYLLQDYHLFSWSLFLAAGLVVLAVINWKKMREGGLVLFAFLAISIVLTVHHPNRKSRFVHTWVTVGWVLAGAGLAELMYSRRRLGGWSVRPWLAGTATASLLFFHHTGILQSGHAPEGGVSRDRPSTLDILAKYRPHLAGVKRLALLSNRSFKFYSLWTVLETNGNQAETECDLHDIDPATVDSAGMTRWLEQNHFDRIVYIHIEKGSPFEKEILLPGMERVERLLAEQSSLKCIHRERLPLHRCTVTVWVRGAAPCR